MSHLLPAVPQVLPGMHYQPGRRHHHDNPYVSPPLPAPAPHAPLGYQHHHQHHPAPHHPQPQHYPPHAYRPYHPYHPAAMPAAAVAPPPPPPPPPPPLHHPHQYPHGPLVVSSYPHSHPPLPMSYQPLPPPAPPPRLTSSTTITTTTTTTTTKQPPVLSSPTGSDRSSRVVTPAPTSSTLSQSVETLPVRPRSRFIPPLPWYSVPDASFPPRARRRRRKRIAPEPASSALELPQGRQRQQDTTDGATTASQTPATLAVSETETPLTSHAPSEADSTHPTTPSSSLPVSSLTGHAAPAAPSSQAKPSSRPILPAVPLAPALPLFPDASRARPDHVASPPPSQRSAQHKPEAEVATGSNTPVAETRAEDFESKAKTQSTPEKPKAAPRSWADLVRSTPRAEASGSKTASSTSVTLDENPAQGLAASLAETLSSFGVEGAAVDTQKMSFLEPRGLVNTGNMCYMNSVLVYCVPFYAFLERIAKRTTHSFKDDTPLLDALILFVREFRVIDSAASEDQIALRLKDSELEQYGEAFIPDFVYDIIRRLPRFSSMRRGHQQDAEEFLGFLLEGLHNECVQVMKGAETTTATKSGASTLADGALSPSTSPSRAVNADAGWLEVGPKQRAAVTRASGIITTESPMTKIFGGKLRSELRVPGLKNSVTLEPYQPLQLDIQSPEVNNVTDALKGLTRPETLHGNFNSPRGPNVTATKQVFIESLPPVLILHLKRFQYDNKGGTQKIWKKVGYPLDLEIPKEVFPPHKRAARQLQPARYRLIAVVYHHGKNAGGGHYTVDVRRQDGREWIRLDDTVIRRIRKDDVAEGGTEEDPAVLAAALEQHRKDAAPNGGNVYDQIGLDWVDMAEDEEGWRQVNGSHGGNGKSSKPSSSESANGTQTPSHHRNQSAAKQSIRDNKVAYLLFYQRI